MLTAWDFCAECSYYFLAGTIFAIGYFNEQQIVGINIGHNLLSLICSIYKYEDKPECANIRKQFNRYTNNANTCFHSKSNFEHMVYLRVFLGQWCYLYHPCTPKEKTKQKSVYTAVLKIFTKPGKKMHILCGGHGLILWSLFGYFPLWFRTNRTLPDKKNKNLIVIANKFNLDIDTQEQADGLVSSIAIGLSNQRHIPMDNTCVEHEICKYGRFLRGSSESWYTWCFPQQVMYDAYDPLLMVDKQTRNQIVVISQTGTKKCLFRTSILGQWMYNENGCTSTLTIDQIVCSSLVQDYIPDKNATVDTFLALGDNLFEGTGNTLLLTYLSKLYPNCSDLQMDPICLELQNNASLQNYKLICKH